MASRLSKQHLLQQSQRLNAAASATWCSLLQGLTDLEGLASQQRPSAEATHLRGLNSSCSISSISSCPSAIPQHQGSITALLQQQHVHSKQQQHIGVLQDNAQRYPRMCFLQNASIPATLQIPAHQHADIFHHLQQQRHYHPSQHRARALTVKLQQKQQWQDLQLMFDNSGSGKALNAIHLSLMLLQLSRVAPSPELVPESERRQLKQFISELVVACHQKLHRMDHRALASFTQSLVALKHDVHQQPPAAAAAAAVEDQQQQQSATHRSSSSGSSLLVDILGVGIKQIPLAGAVSCSVLASSVAAFLQQQQQWMVMLEPAGLHPQQQQQQQQQLLLLQGFVQALTNRIHNLTATGRLPTVEACKLCLAANRLAAAVRTVTTAAAAAGAVSLAGTSAMTKKLYRVTQQLAAAMTPLAADAGKSERLVPAEQVGLLLYSLAISRTWPGWEALLHLLGQYSAGVDAVLTHAASSLAHSRNSRRSASGAATIEQQGQSAVDEVIKSLPSTVWAVGRFLEQQTKQQQPRQKRSKQQQQIQEQLQHQTDVGCALDSCLVAAGNVVASFSPAQLAHLAAGLSKISAAGWTVLGDAKALLQEINNQPGTVSQQQQQQQQDTEVISAGSQEALPTAAAAAGTVVDVSTSYRLQQACDQLEQQLKSPSLQQFLQQHLAQAERLLPLIPFDVRKQLADSYRQLDVQLPSNLSAVFERDALRMAAASVTDRGDSSEQTSYWHV